jgi:hypothetical protein
VTLLTLCLCIATFLLVAGIGVLLLSRRHRPDTDVILDAIDGARDEIDSNAKHTVLEHEALSKQMSKANGRLQFLLAKEIAEELGDLAAAVAEPKKDEAKEPPP